MSNKYLVFLVLSLSLFIICAACGTHVNGGGEDSVTGRVEFVVSGTSDGGSAIALPNAKVPNDPH